MKKLTATLLATSLLSLAAFAQGTVNFVNLNGAAGVNAPVYLSDGTTKVGAGFTAELLAGTTANNLVSVATTGFLSAAPGYFSGGVVTLAGIPGGATSTAFLEVRVFSTASGSYAAALAAGAPNTYGNSAVFSVHPGDPTTNPPGTPAPLVGLTSFNLVGVPEPSSLALAGLGAAAMLVFRRRK